MERLNRWFSRQQYTDPIQRQQAFNTYGFAVAFMVSTIPILLVIITINGGQITAPIITGATLLILLMFASALAAINLTRERQQPIGGMALIVAWMVLTTATLFTVSPGAEYAGMLVFGMLMLLTLLPPLLTTVRILHVGIGTIAFAGLLVLGQRLEFGNPAQAWQYLGFSVLLFGVFSQISFMIVNGTSESIRNATAAVSQRLGLFEASNGVIRRILARTDLEALMKETAGLVREGFPILDTVQIWLTDADRRTITQRATNTRLSPVDGHEQPGQVGVGSLNAVGRVAVAGELIIVRDLPEEQAYRRGLLPPGIRSQLVLPLKIASDVIGVLDLQSRSLNAFEKDDIEVLSALSDQIAIAIDNARLVATTQTSLAENKRLYEQTRSSLREIERLNQQLTGQAWSEYLRARANVINHTYNFATETLENYAEWTPTLQKVSRQTQPITEANANTRIVAFPVVIRGQVIGALEYELDPDRVIQPEQMAAIQLLLERMALSAENLRLFDEAQRIAQREAMVNEITQRMQGATSVDATLNTAAQGLAGVLNTSRVSIRIGTAGLPAERAPERT
jgi:GAF domain-containing protein